jgi:hypothetical protein
VEAPLGHVGLAADDRLDPGFPAGLVEGHDAVEGAVVRDRQRLLSRRLGGGHQLRDAAGAVEQTVLAVGMEVDEAWLGQVQEVRKSQVTP